MKIERQLWMSGLLLLLLLGVTVGAAYIPLGTGSVILALLIAVLKTAIVATVFMELIGSSTLLRVAALCGVVWLAILITLAFCDYYYRSPGIVPTESTVTSGQGWSEEGRGKIKFGEGH